MGRFSCSDAVDITSFQRYSIPTFYFLPTALTRAFPLAHQFAVRALYKVLVYGIAKGNLEHVFSGDEPGRHTGELLGHSGVVTALFFYKHMVYTGSMDCTVQVISAGREHTYRRC